MNIPGQANDVSIQNILDFWFGNDPDDAATARRQAGLWWGKDASVDARIAERFGALVRAARDGSLAAWCESARGRLAVIILIDQFSRNIHRDSADAFSADALALEYCQAGINLQHDQQLRPIERVFLYLPLEHAEDAECQQRCIELMQGLAAGVPEAWRATFDGFVDYARRHAEVIERFGRFPHRNAVLGRTSSEREIDYLSQPGAGF